MKKICFYKKMLQNESGAALALALSVILVLTSLGVIALMSSAANVGMSGKTFRWTKDFYRLDAKATEYERMIDNALFQAEEDAREYVKNRMDRLLPYELTGVYSDVSIYNMANHPTNKVQQFFHDYYLVNCTYVNIDGDFFEYALDDYLNYTGDLKDISRWFKDNPGYTPPASEAEKNADIEAAYISDIETYTSELFDRVYFYMLSMRLEMLVKLVYYGDIVIKNNISSPITAGYNVEAGYMNPDYFITDKFNKFTGIPALSEPREPSVIDAIRDKWNDIKPNDDDIGIFIRVNAASLASDPLDDPKEVHVYISITKPSYETVLKSIYTPIKGNPIWTNALSVQGNIVFDDYADVNVTGDVYASGVHPVTGNVGISVNAGADVTIYGNVYTYGDLQIAGTGGTLLVTRNPSLPAGFYDIKNKIFNEEGYLFEDYFDDGVFDVDDYATIGADGAMPFVFKDAVDAANVYCRDLLVAPSVLNGSLTATGNIWTSDDIQMDGQNSTIRIGNAAGSKTYYIGLNPFSSVLNPNASSSVINNYPFEGGQSKIILNSNFVIPGVAFYEFDQGPAFSPYFNSPYYRSLESVAARKSYPTSTIYGYLSEGSGVIYRDTVTGDEFEVYGINDEMLRRDALRNFINAQGGIKTNVLTDLPHSDVDGYVAEIAPIQHSASDNATLYTNSPDPTVEVLPHSTANSNRYSTLTTGSDNYLMEVFKLKTQKLGANVATGSFNDFVDESVLASLNWPDIIKFTSSGTLDINVAANQEGIVYCKGDLTIIDSDTTSHDTFKGTIICTGNVTIRDDVTIIYDEDKVLDKLIYNENVRKFFENGSMGKRVADYMEYSTSSGTRTIPKRYRIREWKEVTGS